MRTDLRISKDNKTAHLVDCARSGCTYPWNRVSSLSDSGIRAVAAAQGTKFCSTCRPLEGKNPRFPRITVVLAGSRQDDPFFVIGRVSKALMSANVEPIFIDHFISEISSSEDPISIAKKWVTVA